MVSVIADWHSQCIRFMPSKDDITHPGIIQTIDDKQINVKILAQSACSSCHAKGMCSVAEMEEKIVVVVNDGRMNYSPGDSVILKMKKSLGPRAVFLGYFLPFLIVTISLFILVSITGKEGISALISLGLLIPYYLVLSFLKDRLAKRFNFAIDQKADQKKIKRI